jgi:phosphoesterase RecJ-like protein
MSNKLIDQFQKIDELLHNAQRILLASHENPDPDAVASVLALHCFFKKKNLQSFPYLPDAPPKYLSFLPGFFEIKTVPPPAPDLLFCLDYGDFKRLRIPEHILKKSPLNIVTVDHHLQGDQKGTVKILEPEFSSTTEIIYQWLLYENFKIDREIAGCILTGIFSDSGGFKHVSTSAATFRAVSELLSKGVSLDKIVRSTLGSHPARTHFGASRAWGRVLDRIKLDKKTGLAYSWISASELKKFEIKIGDFDGLTNLIAAGSPISLGLFLLEHWPGEIKGSLRSEPSGGVDVARIAKAMGGGGHSYAAGFQQKGNIEETLKKVLNLIE